MWKRIVNSSTVAIRSARASNGSTLASAHINSCSSEQQLIRPLALRGGATGGAAPMSSLAADRTIQHGEVVDPQRDYRVIDEVLGAANEQILNDTYSRLFAVVYFYGKQFKITAEDLIAVQSMLPLEVGQTISLDKVMLVGGTDFSIVGRPLIDKNIVRVLATVVEKTLGHEYRRFFHIQRTRVHRSYFFRQPYSVLRINGIQLLKPIEP